MIIHVVRPGDSLYRIAQAYGVTYQQIVDDNRLTSPDVIVPGQTLVIMTDTIPHTVTRGQTMYSLAQGYRIPLSEVIRANPQITDPSRISIGQVINMPVGVPKLGTIEVNGYAYPNIESGVLQSTLPYLTYLSIFSHQVRPDGSLTSINDEPLIAAARQAGVAPLMVITNIDEQGGFSSELANAVLANPQIQETLLNNIVQMLQSKNYYGLDIDFEYVYQEDRVNYNNFLRRAVEKLRPLGYTVTTALAPKTSGDMAGLLYEAHDYPVHGELADHVILMTYEWGYTFGPPMAVQPINQVRRVLNYATSVIPSQKILMGMPNYGYDWTLPYTPGTAARTITNVAAVELAGRVGATIQYDTTSQSPFFYYTEGGRNHVVWFEDARSVQASLRLVNEYNLGGVSYWTINRFFPQNWLVLQSMYDIKKLL